jgi:hypothetical protein
MGTLAWRFLCIILAFAPAAPLRAQTPAAPYRALALGPARRVSEGALTVGHGKLTFTGAWAPLTSRGRQVGVYLQGQGTLEYTSAFAPEAPIFARNLKTWSGLGPAPTEQGQRVVIPFERARVFLGGRALPAWEGVEAEGLQAGLEAFRGSFGHGDAWGIPQKLALQAANAPSLPYAAVELEAGKSRWIHEVDGFDRMEESLAWVETVYPIATAKVARLSVVRLSSQPLGWDPRLQLAPVAHQVQDLEVDLATPDNRNVELKVRERLLCGMAGQTLLRFRLFSERNSDYEVRRLKVSGITDGDGHSLAFDHADNHLLVALAAPTRAGAPLTLTFTYGGDFLYQPDNNNFWHLEMNEGWYPLLPTFGGELCTFHGVVRTQGEWTAFLPGDTVRRVKEGPWNLVETRSDKPLNFLTILGGKYFVDEETRDGLTVRIATYGFKPGVAKKVIKDQTFDIVKYYQKFLGPFPFREFLIVEKPELWQGQAPPGMMFITREAFEQLQLHRQAQDEYTALASQLDAEGHPRYTLPRMLKSMNVRHVFAHEIAHQYWGTVVKMASPEDQWLSEAFADYTAALYDLAAKGQTYWEGNVGQWFSRAAMGMAAGPIPLANAIHPRDPYERFAMRTDLLYNKGPALLNALHTELGDETFLVWFKSIQSNFRWKFATTNRVFDLLAFITKKDFKPFLNQYYWGLELPVRRKAAGAKP